MSTSSTYDSQAQSTTVEQLLSHGYEPIPIAGKGCYLARWSTLPCRDLWVEAAARGDHRNIGLRTGALVGVDVDLTDPAHLRQAVDLVEKLVGPSFFQRVGRKGTLLCYRNTGEMCRKLAVGPSEPDENNKRKPLVEFLGLARISHSQ